MAVAKHDINNKNFHPLDNAHAEHTKKLGPSKKENPSKRFKQLPVAPGGARAASNDYDAYDEACYLISIAPVVKLI
ncbi:MAG: hypothetical protein MR592_07530 [Prevotella sp.]|mgnify:FL=1|nr:hypothetical protein [Prevotella sp.]